MPDYLKEEVQALKEAVERLINKNEAQKGLGPAPPGRVVGTSVPIAGGSGAMIQDHFTTGYDSVNKVTVVPFTLGFSPLGSDSLTM